MPEIDNRKCVVDIETLTFKPAHGERLQTARRGKRFIHGNIRRQLTGKVKEKKPQLLKVKRRRVYIKVLQRYKNLYLSRGNNM